ncbi:MAG: Rrf2 family transcriptional regulator [Candidatus Bipolaricaulis sp.]|nr:Rrf2 family transcriptional regulator [Candidatus Bipolaricaulis sp.]
MDDVLRIPERTALGLHAMVLLSEAAGALSSAELARELRASQAHLSKVLERLTSAGLVESRRGPNGGYSIAPAARNVSLLRVYEVLEGTPRRDGCLFASPVCEGSGCILGDLVGRARRNVLEALETTTLAQAAKRRRRP